MRIDWLASLYCGMPGRNSRGLNTVLSKRIVRVPRVTQVEALEDRALLSGVSPVAITDSYNSNEDTVLTVNAATGVLANDTDAEFDPLTATVDVAPAHGSLTLNADGSFVYTPAANFNGADSFTYHANDGTSDSLTTLVTLVIAPVNDTPVAVNDAYSTAEDTPLTVTLPGVLANDTDADGDPLIATLAVAPTNGTVALAPDGSLVYTPNANFNGTDSFTYTATDGIATSSPATVTITVTAVNDAPVAVPDTYAGTEDTPLVVNAATGVLANDTDVDGDPLTASLVSGPTNGSLTLNANGSFSYTPNANFNGADSFVYMANDGTADSLPTVVTLTIAAVNDTPVAVSDAYTTSEDTPLTVAAPGVLANDTDADGDPLVATMLVAPTNGTVALAPNGALVYTPNANFNGTDSFTYTATDGIATSAPATVTITVTAVNDAPVAIPDAYAATEDTPLIVNAATGVLANDTDVDGDTLTSTVVTGPTNGVLTLNPNGSFTYTPNANFNGADSFTYVANDGTVDSLPTVVTLTIAPVNDTPVAADDAYTTAEDTPLTVTLPGVLANDTDADGDPLVAAVAVGPTHGTLALAPNGSLVYTPNANFNGTDTFTYTASDGVATSAPATVTITVTSVNDAPVGIPDAYAATEDTPLVVNAATGVLANDTDADGDTLTAAVVTVPTKGVLVLNPNGSFTYTPNANANGADSFTYVANDGTANSLPTLVTLTIAPVNDTPVAVNDAYTTAEDTPLTVTLPGVLANDTDADGDPLVAAVAVGPTHGTLALAPNGSLVYTPNANYNGTDTFTYTASDGVATSAPATVTITVTSVNDAPVAAPDAYNLAEDSPLIVNAANGVLANDTDADGDTLTAVLVTGPTNGVLALSPNGSFTYTPNANFHGTDNFTYVANDGTANSLPTVVALTIASVNDAPVAVADAYGATEDTPLIVNAATGVLANDTDIDGDPLTAILNASPVNGTLVLNPNGSFTYTPNANFNGVDTFTYLANDGTANSLPTVVTLTVAPVNDAPVAVNDAYVTAEDTPLSVLAPNGVLANDTDADGDPLTSTLAVAPTNGTVILAPNGSLVYTPNANFHGTDSFTYTASDGVATSAPATVTITVTSVNDAPVALPDAYNLNEDTPLVIAAAGVLANDTDVDGDTLTANLVTGATHGVVVLNSNGSFTYTPAANYNGVDTFTYAANDGTANSLPTTVTLTIAPVNDAPVAVNDAYTVAEDTPLAILPPAGVLANDTDADGDPLTAAIGVAPLHGTVALAANGSFVYTPNANFNGTDTFTYTAHDATSTSTPATVTITVTSVNDAPVATADTYAASEDTPLIVNALTGVLANDTDADGDTLTANLVTSPVHGTLVLNSNGSFTYTPDANFNGIDTFTYLANDGSANSNLATVTLNVASVDDAPVSLNDAYFVNEDAILSVPTLTGVLANDTDIEGDPLTASVVAAPANGTLVLNANGSFTYTPNHDFNGTDTFTYKANDGTMNGNVATVTITVIPQPEAPIIITSPGHTAAKGHRRAVVDPAIVLLDADSPSFDGGHLDVSIQTGAGKRDSLSYKHVGARKGAVNTRLGELRVGTTAIGRITGGTHGAPLHIEFNSNATQALVQQAMQSLTFRGTLLQHGTRVVAWQITDDTGLSSNVATKDVDVS
jgi:VCBS repeat-containing protein